MKLRFIIGLSLIGLFTACSDSNSEEPIYKPADYVVSGKVEKGPFVSGSTINLQPMDARLQPNGSTFSTTITDHLGNFSFGTRTLEAPYAQLTANGYFFNEVKGRLSDGTLSLRAVVNVADASTVNVNILTHLKYQRMMNLVEKDRTSFTDANKQAQKELMAAFGLERLADTDVSKYSIAAGTDEAAALIAISSLILKNRSEAEVTEYLAKLSSEFGETGAFSVETKEQMKDDRASLLPDLDIIEKNVIARYEELNQSVSVKPLEAYFDWDDDGVAGNEFVDPAHMPTVSQSEFSVPKGGGEYSIDVTSDVPLYTEPQPLGSSLNLEPDVVVVDERFSLYDKEESPATVSTDYVDGKLKIKVGNTAARTSTEHTVCLYDLLGNTAVTIHLTQEGDSSLPLPGLGNDGKNGMLPVYQNLANAMFYTTFNVNYYPAIYSAPLSPSSSWLNDMWQYYYSAISRLNIVSHADQLQLNVFGPQFSVIYAMCYYNMITLWGDVPYVTYDQTANGFYNFSRTSQNDVLAKLTADLRTAVEALEEKQNGYENIDDLFGASKDVARALLAQIYMYQGKYDDARPMLSKIKSNGFYNIANPDEQQRIQDEETIYGLKPSVSNTRAVSAYNNVQAISYPDILLLLAECEYNIGNEGTARSILSDFASKKNYIMPDDDVPHCIMVLRMTFTNMPGLFAYMKRAGLAESELNLQPYQLLLPIPQTEIYNNPSMTQNPGYNDTSTRFATRTHRIIKR